MQGLWYGDRRDRVKWGALVHLANTKGVRCIVQIAYFRHGTDLKLQTEKGEVELPTQVWNHFSNLRHIERLGEATGLKIIVLDQSFEPNKRRDYINRIVLHLEQINEEIKGRKIIFLDPDTGIAPGKKGKPEHVNTQDIKDIWGALSVGDLFVVYQHANRTKNWVPGRKEKMSSACAGMAIKTITGKGIASDVAMLWCCKAPANEDTLKSPAADLRPAKIGKKGRLCACQCGRMTKGGYFYSGDDAVLKSTFLKVSKGDIELKELDGNRQKMYRIWKEDKRKRLIDIAKEVLG